jgi:SAM-dependent methyltransferase
VIRLADCPIARAAFGELFVPAAGKDTSPPAGRGPNAIRHTAWSHSLPDGRDFLISEEPGATGHGVILSGASGDGPETPAADARAAIIREAAPAYLGPLPSGSDGAIEVSLLGKAIRFDLRCFFQSNLEMTARLIPWALDGLNGESALDLYCGVGLFGAFLADKFKSVLAVEENPISLEYALGNIGATHDFLRGRVEDLLPEERGPLASARPDCIVVDPPRTGLDKAVAEFLVAKRPADLIYVSCNPVTLARDLKGLLAAGFALADLRLFDFYPQTAHVEAVAKLKWVGPVP